MHSGSSGSKPFIVEPGEIISDLIRYNFQSTLWEFWVEATVPLLRRLNWLNNLALLTAYYDVINKSYVTWLVRTNYNCGFALDTDIQTFVHTHERLSCVLCFFLLQTNHSLCNTTIIEYWKVFFFWQQSIHSNTTI